MKKLLLSLTLLALSFAGANNLSAQGYDPRVDISRNAADQDRAYRGRGDDEIVDPDDRRDGRDLRDGRDGRASGEIDRLMREVYQLRREIGDSRDRRIRARFHNVIESSERLRSSYQRGRIRGWEVRRRGDEIRSEMFRIRQEMRARFGGRRY